MNKETREFLDRKFNSIDVKFEETKRHFGVVAEGLRSEIRQVAEGVANIDEKLYREITVLRQEMKAEFAEIKAMIIPSWTKESGRSRVMSSR